MNSTTTPSKLSKSSTVKSSGLEGLIRDAKILKEWIQVAYNKLEYDRTLTDAQRVELEKKMEGMEQDLKNVNQLIMDSTGKV
jgi:hypothetical protein